MVSFGGSEVERWWKLNGILVRSFSIVAQLWCSGHGVYFLGEFFFGVSSDDGLLDIIFIVVVS